MITGTATYRTCAALAYEVVDLLEDLNRRGSSIVSILNSSGTLHFVVSESDNFGWGASRSTYRYWRAEIFELDDVITKVNEAHVRIAFVVHDTDAGIVHFFTENLPSPFARD